MNSRREQAVALRLAGKSRREIKEILGIAGNSTLDDLLAGVPPPEWTRRPNAKDDLRVKARELREQGLAYNQIAAELGVSKSSVSLWVRDLPRPEGLSYEECCRRVAEGVRRYWAAERPVLEAAGVDRNMIVYRVYIHETADVAGAERLWLEVTGADPALFRRPALKRHQPLTV